VHVTAIIAAGGRGARFGGDEPKQLLLVGGRAILDRSVSAFRQHPDVTDVVVALPPDLVEHPPHYLRSPEGRASEAAAPRLVAGGERRQDSVANAFRAADPKTELVVIHDAARPFVSDALIAKTIQAAAESGAAIAALRARDTLKQGELMVRHGHHERYAAPLSGRPSGERSWVVASTLPRDTIFLAQTPQAFRRDVLESALARGTRDGIDATDEAALAEHAGHTVRIVDGETSNIKVTTRDDLTMAEAIARTVDRAAGSPALQDEREPFRRAPARTGRAGTGYDLHRLAEGRPLMICGINVPAERGALGHSDADVGCHAIADAILGAIGLGDIGRHFPDSDDRWKGAAGLDLLARTVALVAEQGFEVGNVDVTILLERPKLREHVAAMRAALADVLRIDAGRVSVKAKTNEGLDAVGRGEAVAAHAVALIRARQTGS
jgi:2-C-methyl-D-erythritol 4-phosphate cytidylyltransferase / 2-C-methyl-D-erythritol 2,4-cyclodiphosphate synthase